MTGPVAIVVGAGRGLGAAVARRFAREGFSLALLARSEAQLAERVTELEALGVQAAGFAADAGSPQSLQVAFERAAERFGEPEVLVYNAVAPLLGAPSTTSPEDLIDSLKVNVGGALAATKLVLPTMRAASRGTILLTGGGLALNPYVGMAGLAVGKAALRSLAATLATELEPEGIHVGLVSVMGVIEPGTAFDPDAIAEAYWSLHAEPRGQWQAEVRFQGS